MPGSVLCGVYVKVLGENECVVACIYIYTDEEGSQCGRKLRRSAIFNSHPSQFMAREVSCHSDSP